jgi:hypothetical protein
LLNPFALYLIFCFSIPTELRKDINNSVSSSLFEAS